MDAISPALDQKETNTPEYMEEFQCIGGACEDTCCAGWTVSLDKKTYYAYKGSTNPTISEIAQRSVKSIKNGRSAGNYAKIKLDQGNCPFLSKCGLCQVQSTIGEEALSKTCRTFPRRIKIVGDKTFITGMMSCPEVARLSMGSDTALDLKTKITDSTTDFKRSGKFHYAQANNKFSPLSQGVMQACDQFLDDVELSISEQLVCISMLLKDFIVNPKSVLPSEIDTYSTKIKDAARAISMAETRQEAAVFQVQLFNQVLLAPNYAKDGDDRFTSLVRKMCYGLNYYENDAAVLIGTYIAARDKVYDPFDNDNRFLWRNFLRNEFYGNPEMFIEGNGKALDRLEDIAARATLIRFGLICLAAQLGPKFSSQCYIDTMSIISRVVEHNEGLTKAIKSHFASKDDNVMVIATLLLS